MSTELSDEELMSRYQGGDASTFEVLYRRHKGAMYRFLRRQCSAEYVDELFQDVWTRVIGARARYRVEAKFSTWLYQIAHNRLIDWYRQQGRIPADTRVADEDALPADADNQPDQQLSRQQQAEALKRALTQLPELQREVFLLRYESGLSIDEVAAVVGVKPETARSRLRYAMSKLGHAVQRDS